jgi:hypothetical protein
MYAVYSAKIPRCVGYRRNGDDLPPNTISFGPIHS